MVVTVTERGMDLMIVNDALKNGACSLSHLGLCMVPLPALLRLLFDGITRNMSTHYDAGLSLSSVLVVFLLQLDFLVLPGHSSTLILELNT